MYELYINTEFVQGNPVFKSLEQHLHFFIHFGLIKTAWGPKFEPQCLHFNFPLISLFILCLMELRGCGIDPPQPHLNFIFIAFKFLSFDRGVLGSNHYSPSLIFFIFLLKSN